MRVGPGDQRVQRSPATVAQHVVLASGLAAIGRGRPGQFTAALGPHAHAVHRSPGPVEQVVLGEPVEHDPMQPLPHPGVLPLAQPPANR
jgi:hypothetical protein